MPFSVSSARSRLRQVWRSLTRDDGVLLNAYAWQFGRPGFRVLNELLFKASLRGMGVLNYQDFRRSGEAWLMERVLRPHCATLGRTPLFVDVGANTGEYSLTLRGLFPDARIVAFEPHPHAFATMQRAVQQRTSQTRPIELRQAALGSSCGTIELFDYAPDGQCDTSSHASLYSDVITGIHAQKEFSSHFAPMQTLDAVFSTEGAAITFLKIDTEGHEAEVLRGAHECVFRHAVDIVQFEFNEMNVVSRVFLRDFLPLLPGYRLFRLLPHGLLPIHYNSSWEVFKFQNIVALSPEVSTARIKV